MSNDPTSYSREFKAKVVLELLSGESAAPEEITGKYSVTGSQILSWAKEMDLADEKLNLVAEAFQLPPEEVLSSDVELESDDETFLAEIEYGVTFDKLNYRNLTFWWIFGTGFVFLIILTLIFVSEQSLITTQQQVSERSEYREVQQLRMRDHEILSSFGVVDAEAGIFRIPVDSVISQMSQGRD